MVQILSLEGNIGSGKSTIINNLKQMYGNNNNIHFLQEPIDIWEEIKDSSGKNMITKFYEDQERYSFSFQIMAYISRLSILKAAIKQDYKLIICERSLMTDKEVFCKMLYDTNKIESVNYQIYLKWFDEFIQDLPNISYIYIKTTPEVAYNRILKRNRPGENISLDYIKMCNDYHNSWLYNENTSTSLVFDGDLSESDIFNIINEFLNI
jgi:deoxyadenosine/deoxycytidine kinase